MGQRTCLYDWHVAHDARMVDFGGWDMPVQYSTIIEEHTAVRTGCGLFDVSHMGRLSFGGPDTLALIQRIQTNNAATMKDMQARYGLVCNDQGGIRDDVLVYRWPYGFAMVVNASNREKIVGWIKETKGTLNVEMQDQTLTTCMIAVQGPKSAELVRGLTEADPTKLAYYYAAPTRYAGNNCAVSRTGYTGEDGFEFMVGARFGVQLWDELLKRGAKPCGLGARDTLRLEAAMPLYGHELSEDIDPYQAGLGWAVKLDKGDFRGKEALMRRQKDATARRRVGLELEGKRIAREGAKVRSCGQDVGTVTSGTFAPTLHKTIAMAYVEPSMAQPGTQCQVDIRGSEVTAKVVPLPFYKRSK
ncbi:MAG: glycine cleavage system aminomethyltransferase GcvT [Gemmataceae bacterium]|nr:glycine cleavage system aminomethyltransferase GcvT [Gemmataceae bacterium]MCI0743523.1 glycine cleavage system aminomethyltransferase GcvT [Gemmataceae bacterium]